MIDSENSHCVFQDDTEFLTETEDSSDADSVSTGDRFQIVDLCFPALNYLHRCHKILASIYTMPALPIFQVSPKEKKTHIRCIVDLRNAPKMIK